MLKAIHHYIHRHYHRRYYGVYKHARQLFIFDIGLLSLAALMMGASIWLYVWKPNIASQIDIRIFLGDVRIKSGDETHLSVHYVNRSKKTLTNATLAIRLPDGFIVDDNQTPSSTFINNSFAVPDLAPGAEGNLDVYGVLWSDIGKEKQISATLSYTQKNQSDEEIATGIYLLTLSDSELDGALSIATTTFSNQRLSYQYSLVNHGSHTVVVKLHSNNDPNLPDQLTLVPQETKMITSTIATPDSNEIFNFAIQPSVVIHETSIAQKISEASISILSPHVQIEATLATPTPYAETDMVLPLKISWRNESRFETNNQVIKLVTTPGVIDVASTIRNNHLTHHASELAIDKQDRTALSNGKPGTGEEFIINLRLLPTFSKRDEQDNLSIRPIFEAGSDTILDQTFKVEGQALSIPLASEVHLKNEIRYYTDEGDQLGRGPLPPIVGKTTKYWVFMTLGNTTNPLDNAALSVWLAPGVEFAGDQSVTIGPELEYDSANRVLRWQDDYIPANSQSGFYFAVSVRPGPEQLGKTIPLLDHANFSATDENVKKRFDIRSGSLNNILGKFDNGSRSSPLVSLPEQK